MSSGADSTPLPAAVVDFQRKLHALQEALRDRSLLPAAEHEAFVSAAGDTVRESGILVLRHDLKGRITAANGAARTAFGYGMADMIGVEVRHLFASEYLPRLAEHAVDQLERGSPFPFEIRANGPTGPVWLEVVPRLCTRSGEIEAIEVVGRDISDRRRKEELARRDALHDALTGLPNRRLFLDRLEQALMQAERTGCHVAVLFLDLDRFKLFNDAYGHGFGDELLRAVSDRLVAAVRDTDTVSRRGGDEFTILLPSLDAPDAVTSLAARILDQFESPVVEGGQSVHVGTSIGIAVYPGDGRDADALLHAADIAMYRAKAEGRGCARFFHEGMQRGRSEDVEIEHALREALRTDTLGLAFQPRFDLKTERLVAFEALLRVSTPAGRPLPAAAVIRVAEETGLIGAVGAWVLDQTCATISEHGAATDVVFVVNVTERECLYGDLPASVARALAAHSVGAHRLELDLSHGFASNEDETARAVMHELSSLGVRLGLDGFGSAKTSLRTLRAPHLASVTLAREYVDDLLTDDRVAALTQGIIDLVHALDLDVAAVGVATDAQLDWLRNAGCDVAQGSACGDPVDARTIQRFFAQ